MPVNIEMIDASKPDEQILKHASELILQGEVIVCPTDTGYAFSANALDTTAITKVFNLKGRSFSNPIHVAVNSMEETEKYAFLNETAQRLAHYFLPGALTMVLPRKQIVPAMLVGGRDTIGIRIPDNKIILGLTAMCGLPLTTTSANISGEPTPYSVKDIIKQLSENIEKVALILDQGTLKSAGLSTIIDLTVDPPQILRQGLIGREEISDVLKLRRNSSNIEKRRFH